MFDVLVSSILQSSILLTDNFGEWVESMCMDNGNDYQEADVASGCNLWVWLEGIGVVTVSWCCCKEVL